MDTVVEDRWQKREATEEGRETRLVEKVGKSGEGQRQKGVQGKVEEDREEQRHEEVLKRVPGDI